MFVCDLKGKEDINGYYMCLGVLLYWPVVSVIKDVLLHFVVFDFPFFLEYLGWIMLYHCDLFLVFSFICIRYSIVCPPVRGDNPRA